MSPANPWLVPRIALRSMTHQLSLLESNPGPKATFAFSVRRELDYREGKERFLLRDCGFSKDPFYVLLVRAAFSLEKPSTDTINSMYPSFT